jgi:hypothetical protein
MEPVRVYLLENLPMDILLEIASHLGMSREERSWMGTCRKFADVYYSIKYKQVDLDLRDQSPRGAYQKITASPFNVFQHVKKIKFTHFNTPTRDHPFDPLQEIINLCENVIEVDFPNNTTLNDWTHFTNLLTRNNNKNSWTRLRFLPANYTTIDISPDSYHDCALHCSNFLERYTTLPALIRHGQTIDDLLAPFTNLKKLEFGSNVLDELYTCDRYLDLLPRLKEFGVRGFQNELVAAGRDIYIDHPNVQILQLRRFVPTNSNQIEYIINSFKSLDSLLVEGQTPNDFDWSTQQDLSTQSIQSFFRFVSNVPLFTVLVTIQNHQQPWLYDELYRFCSTDRMPVGLTIGFAMDGVRFRGGYPLQFRITNGSIGHTTAINLLLLYESNDNHQVERANRLQDIVTQHHCDMVQVLNVDLNGRFMPIDMYLEAISNLAYPNLQHLSFIAGTLDSYTRDQPRTLKSHISTLTFNTSEVTDLALFDLFTDIPRLDRFQLLNCHLRAEEGTRAPIEIVLSRTDIGVFQFELEENLAHQGPVYCKLEQIGGRDDGYLTTARNYYYLRGPEFDSVELNETDFYDATGNLLPNQFTLINITCRSLIDFHVGYFAKDN